MAKMTGAQALVASLRAHGTEVVFGVLGGTLLSVYDELYGCPDIRLITPRGEDGAAHMADAYARVTGKVGVCLLTVGAGAAYSVSAMGEAYAESWPVLNICTQLPSPYLDKNKGVYHECRDQLGMFRPVTGWAHRITRVEEISQAIAEAFYRMRSARPRPVMLEIPSDLLTREEEVHIEAPRATTRRQPDAAKVAQAAKLLSEARRPVIWVGGGVVKAQAGEELRQLAEMLQAPVFATNASKGILPDDHPLMLGNTLSQSPIIESQLWNHADVVLGMGTRFSERATKAPKTKLSAERQTGWSIKTPENLIHVDIDTEELGRNYPPTLAVEADVRDFLRALGPALRDSLKPRASRMEEIKEIKLKARAELRERLPAEIQLIEDIRAALPRNAIVSAQSIVGHWARFTFDMYEPGKFLFANTFGSMGFAFHSAIGAKIAYPDRPVIALCGDGGFMFACGEMATIAHYRLSIPLVIFNNGGFKILNSAQKRRFGRTIGTDLTNPDFVKLADSFGFKGIRVENMDELAPRIKEALASPVTTVIDVPIEFKPYH